MAKASIATGEQCCLQGLWVPPASRNFFVISPQASKQASKQANSGFVSWHLIRPWNFFMRNKEFMPPTTCQSRFNNQVQFAEMIDVSNECRPREGKGREGKGREGKGVGSLPVLTIKKIGQASGRPKKRHEITSGFRKYTLKIDLEQDPNPTISGKPHYSCNKTKLRKQN